MIRYTLISLGVMLSLSSSLSFARVVDIELSIYKKGTMLANSPRDRQSAEYWHKLSNQIIASESKLGTQAMWQYAGLSEALAAIAANNRNDIKAYEYWSNSTRYLLTGGTEWPQMQKHLHRRYEQINTQLSTQLTSSDVGISLDNQWEQELTILQVWEEKLGVFTFKGPKLGLKSKSINVGASSSVTPNYNSTRAMKSSDTTGKKKLTGLDSSFSREQSFIPVANESVKELPESKESNERIGIQPKEDTEAAKVEMIELQSGVIITPDEEFDYRNVEKENSKTKEEPKVIEQEKYNPIHKANIGNIEDNKVEVLQRRTFIPVINEPEK